MVQLHQPSYCLAWPLRRTMISSARACLHNRKACLLPLSAEKSGTYTECRHAILEGPHPIGVLHFPAVESKNSCRSSCCSSSYSYACIIISILSKSLHSFASAVLPSSYSFLKQCVCQLCQWHRQPSNLAEVDVVPQRHYFICNCCSLTQHLLNF